jgi:TniQ protein
LDGLTLSRWAPVLPPTGLATIRERWCPHCLREDRELGKLPYLRLSWDIAPARVCSLHKVQLVEPCPNCKAANVRHRGPIVVPGWCTYFGMFPGEGTAEPATPKAMWVARQVGDWAAEQARLDAIPAREAVRAPLETLTLTLDGGRYVAFARRISVAKSSEHGWLYKGVRPGLGAYLRVALHAGIPLAKLMRGGLSDWSPANSATPLGLVLEKGNREERQAPRIHDWGAIRHELEPMLKLGEPINVAEAGMRLGRMTSIFIFGPMTLREL